MLSNILPDFGYNPTNSSLPGTTALWGTTVVSSATANTYGAWGQIQAALTYQVNFIVVTLTGSAASAGTKNVYVDIGIGPSVGSVTTIIQALSGSSAQSAITGLGRVYVIPIKIAAGELVWARAQGTAGTTSVGVHITFCGGLNQPNFFPSCSDIVALGLTTASTTGTTVTPGSTNVEGAWTQIIAATTEDYVGIMASTCVVDTTMSALIHTLDIGIGAAAAEVSISENACRFSHDASENILSISTPMWTNIPSGSRLSSRISCSGVPDSAYSVILYGLRG